MTVAEYDLIIRNGFVVDGTGLPRRRIDVGIRDGKVVTMAHLEGHTAAEEIDADGMIVAPGIVDVHTHYDPQITFDPYATMSCYHGVTTVAAGNCGSRWRRANPRTVSSSRASSPRSRTWTPSR